MTIGNFGTYVAPEKNNPYAETMKAFVEASEANPDASWTVELDAAAETVERNKIAEAANALGKTARLRERDDSQRAVAGTRPKTGNPIYSGVVRLTFTLSKIHERRRGGDGSENAPAENAEKASKGK